MAWGAREMGRAGYKMSAGVACGGIAGGGDIVFGTPGVRSRNTRIRRKGDQLKIGRALRCFPTRGCDASSFFRVLSRGWRASAERADFEFGPECSACRHGGVTGRGGSSLPLLILILIVIVIVILRAEAIRIRITIRIRRGRPALPYPICLKTRALMGGRAMFAEKGWL